MSTNQTAPQFQAGQLLTAAQLNAMSAILNGLQSAWTDYTPTFTAVTTNPTIGGGGIRAGRYIQIGKTIIGEATLTYGATGPGAGSGTYMFGLPVAAASQAGQYTAIVGPFWVYQAASSSNYIGVAALLSSSQIVGRVHGVAGSTNNASPIAWAAGDSMRFCFCYEAA